MHRLVGLAIVLCVIVPSYAQNPGAFLDVNGSKLYYEECGNGPQTVLLVHDGVVHSAVWDGIWPEFCRRFHTIRFDRRGYGKSGESKAAYYETDDVLALLRHLKVEHTAIVGASHGGQLSIDFTLAHPEMVQQLVLVGAVVGGMPYSEHFLNRGERVWGAVNPKDPAGSAATISKDKYLTAPGSDAARKKLAELLAASPQDFSHSEMFLGVKPALPRLGEIHVPTLILVGDADIPDVHAHAGAIEAGIPNSRRVVVEGTGHLMYLEKPDEFSRIVVPFLEENAR
ncbi:MAG TPA: alpha/beta hydrolase [Candidatus Koribacter sp.]|jgi:pimeloyl-ACP methyl ester carboxylesterase